jgi:signal transduction histidine kinase
MSRIVDDLAGHGRLAIAQATAPVDLATIAEEVVMEHSGPAQTRGAHLASRGEDRLEVPSVDRAAIQAAMGNFVSNAVRMAPRGSAVTIDWGEVSGWAWMSVTDQGPGIPPHHHARVFERGWQGAHDRDRRDGAGLGLTIARQLTEAQGGAVTLESEEGGGATFTLWLPLETGADRAAVVAADQVHPVVRPWAPVPASA